MNNTINNETAKKLLDKKTFENFSLQEIDSFNTYRVKAIKLLTPKRLDVIAKYLFLLFQKEKIESDFAERIYKEHISIFSDGEFYEPGSETKNSYEAFKKEYEQLYSSIKRDGFNPNKSLIPVGNDGTIINGGHRVAISIYLNKPVSVVQIANTEGPNYDFEYFENANLDKESVDFLVYNYLKLTQNNIFVICLWPKAVSMGNIKKVEKLIYDNTKIIYRKKIKLTKIGLKNYMTHLYNKESWLGGDNNNFIGAYAKTDLCYANNDTYLYYVEAKNIEIISELKKSIREIYGIGKHSVHITDTKKEAETAADLTLTRNSILALNSGCPSKINRQVRAIHSTYNNTDQLIMNPLYTLRYFGYTTKKITEDVFKISDFGKDLQYDTRNFFYYRNLKFFSPEYASEICGNEYSRQFEKIIKMRKTPLDARIKELQTLILYTTKRNVKRTLRKLGLLRAFGKIIGKDLK